MSKVYTINDTVDALAAKLEVTKKEARDIYDTVVEIFVAALKDDKEVRIPDIGTLYSKERPAREMKVPGKEGLTKIPARKVYALRAKREDVAE